MFVIPPIACVVLSAVLWWSGLLPRPYLTGAIVLVGVGVQLLAQGFSPLWVAALLMNVGTAIYLTMAAVFIAQDFSRVPATLQAAPRFHQEHDYVALQSLAGSLIAGDAALPPLQPTEPVTRRSGAFATV